MTTHAERNLSNDYMQPAGGDYKNTATEYRSDLLTTSSANLSAVSWSAIFAGAAASAVLSLVLLILGTGLGLSSISPWINDGISAKTFGLSSIAWITITSLLAAAVGGYITGRLRVRWLHASMDEVYFRDTAHGFLSWTVATLITVALLSSAISSIVGGGVKAGAAIGGGLLNAAGASAVVAGSQTTNSDANDNSMGYWLDSLFRKDINLVNQNPAQANPQSPADITKEVARIFTNAMEVKSLPAQDLRYVGQLVAMQTGLSQAEAEKRVNDTFVALQKKLQDAEIMARDAADKARKASAYIALWLFISLLISAFTASSAAIFGGQQRDK